MIWKRYILKVMVTILIFWDIKIENDKRIFVNDPNIATNLYK